MSDKQNEDDKFLEQYLSSEDNEVSRLYKSSDEPVPSAETDNAILAAARRAVGSKPQPVGGARKWFVPMSIAAMLAITFSVVLVFQPESEDDGLSSQHEIKKNPDLPDDVDGVTQQFAEPEPWLEYIQELHSEGKVTEAAVELQKFRDTYPDYTIDSSRYPELPSL